MRINKLLLAFITTMSASPLAFGNDIAGPNRCQYEGVFVDVETMFLKYHRSDGVRVKYRAFRVPVAVVGRTHQELVRLVRKLQIFKVDGLEIAHAQKGRERPLTTGREHEHHHDDDRHQNTDKNDLHGHR